MPTKPALPFPAAILALGAVGLVAVVVVLLFFVEIPSANNQIAIALISYVAGWGTASYSYFFGSSSSSQSKDGTISQLLVPSSAPTTENKETPTP